MLKKKKIAIALGMLGAISVIGAFGYFFQSIEAENQEKNTNLQPESSLSLSPKDGMPILLAQNDAFIAPDLVSDRLILRLAEGSELLDAVRRTNGDRYLVTVVNQQIEKYGIRVEFNKQLGDFGDDYFLLSLVGKRLSRSEMTSVMEAITVIPGIKSSEEDVIISRTSAPNDPRYSEQWNLGAVGQGVVGIEAEAAWDKPHGNSRPVIAIVDTGVTSHADLASSLLPGYNFVSDPDRAGNGVGRSADASDLGDWVDEADLLNPKYAGCTINHSSWHGTHVAGIAAAAGNNGTGISGVSQNAMILPVRVLGKCGGYLTDAAAGVLWAAGLPVAGAPINPNPAKIINLSLSATSSCPSYMGAAISKAISAGALVVTAAGNTNTNYKTAVPANCSGAFTVAATSGAGDRAGYSNYGAVSIAAPGGDSAAGGSKTILSTVNSGTTLRAGDAYAHYQGTSMAAPHVAGVAALVAAANPKMTMGEVKNAILRSATPFAAGTACATDRNCGAGIINASAAITESENMEPNLFADKVRGETYFVPNLPSNLKLSIGNSGATEFNGQLPIKVYLSGSEALNFDENPILVGEINPTLKIAAARGMVTLDVPVTITNSVESGTYYLIARINAGADSASEKTFLDNDIDHGQIEVVRPEFEISIRSDTDQAPSTIRAKVVPKDIKLHNLTRRWTYTWTVPADVESDKTSGPELRGVISKVGETPLKVTVSAPNDAYKKESSANFTTRTADPITIEMGIRQSNKIGRAPLSVIVSPSVRGGHPTDRIEASRIWTGAGETLQETMRGRGAFVDLPAGDHTINYSITTKHNHELSYSDTITVIPNLPPTCAITTKKGVSNYTFFANCTDQDGRVRGYSWSVNGTLKTSTSYRLIVPFDIAVNGQIKVELVGKDDSGDTGSATEIVNVDSGA